MIAETASAIAAELNVSPAQTALAWLLHRPGVNIPIIGGRNEAQIKDNLNSVKVKLSADQLKRLDEISAIELGFPHDFLNAKNTNDLLFGGTYEKIRNHRLK